MVAKNVVDFSFISLSNRAARFEARIKLLVDSGGWNERGFSNFNLFKLHYS